MIVIHRADTCGAARGMAHGSPRRFFSTVCLYTEHEWSAVDGEDIASMVLPVQFKLICIVQLYRVSAIARLLAVRGARKPPHGKARVYRSSSENASARHLPEKNSNGVGNDFLWLTYLSSIFGGT